MVYTRIQNVHKTKFTQDNTYEKSVYFKKFCQTKPYQLGHEMFSGLIPPPLPTIKPDDNDLISN